MKTAKARDESSRVDMNEAALTMAIAVLVERIRGLPQEDKEDLFKLSQILFNPSSREEEESASRAFREILDQSKGQVLPFTSDDDPSCLANWCEFVAARIKEAREAAGLTQAQLEDATGLPQSHISRLENAVHSPSSLTLEKIAKATDRPMSFFDPSSSDEQE